MVGHSSTIPNAYRCVALRAPHGVVRQYGIYLVWVPQRSVVRFETGVDEWVPIQVYVTQDHPAHDVIAAVSGTSFQNVCERWHIVQTPVALRRLPFEYWRAVITAKAIIIHNPVNAFERSMYHWNDEQRGVLL